MIEAFKEDMKKFLKEIQENAFKQEEALKMNQVNKKKYRKIQQNR